jgi:hypothetical protein
MENRDDRDPVERRTSSGTTTPFVRWTSGAFCCSRGCLER